jgi:hypothetical protein
MNASRGPVSVIGAAETAVDDVRERLFPVRFPLWLILGLVSFLDQCGTNFGSGFAPPNYGSRGGGDNALPEVGNWLGEHVALAAFIAFVVLTLIALVLVVTTWLSSRGVLMYVEAVATGAEPDLIASFGRNREAANSLFAWRFLTSIAATVILLGTVGIGIVLAFVMNRSGSDVFVGAIGLLGVALLFVGVALTAAFVSLALRDFAAPIQWKLNVPCGEALRMLMPALSRHWLAFLGYLLAKVAVRAAAGVVILLTCCLCCIGLLPIISHTILQPLFFFERAFANRFLEELGFTIMQPLAVSSVAPPSLPAPTSGG